MGHNRNDTFADQPLAPWERELLGATLVDVAVFLVGGESLVFDAVDKDSIKVSKNGLLSFSVGGGRTIYVPSFAYWTEDAR